jgi:hypothetical protein
MKQIKRNAEAICGLDIVGINIESLLVLFFRFLWPVQFEQHTAIVAPQLAIILIDINCLGVLHRRSRVIAMGFQNDGKGFAGLYVFRVMLDSAAIEIRRTRIVAVAMELVAELGWAFIIDLFGSG